MYDIPYHKDGDPAVLKSFIEKHPFAFLIGSGTESYPSATQVPLFLESRDGKEYLSGHLMKHTDHHKAFQNNNSVLAVFSGPHTYVSGSWYSRPGIASTWNYMSVHVKGKIHFLNDEALEAVLRKTSLHFENYDRDSPTIYDNLPEEFKQRVMHAIVAFEVEILDIRHVFKLSQDRDYESYQNIITELKLQGHDGQYIAAEMEKRKAALFSK